MTDNPMERELFEIRVQAALIAIGSVLRATIPITDRVQIRREIERSPTYVPERIDQDEGLRAYYFAQLTSVIDDLLGVP